MGEDLSTALVELKRDEVIEMVAHRVESGEDPLAVLDACRTGMRLVGERFQEGEYFLAELLLSAEIFKGAVAILEPHLAKQGDQEPRGTVVLATMRGDIHDLGKNILGVLLRAHAFDVHDLGVDVEPERLVAEVGAIRPDVVGFSTLITTAFDSTKEAVDLLAEKGLREAVKVAVGGGVTTPGFMTYVVADFQTTDASEGVEFCLEVTR